MVVGKSNYRSTLYNMVTYISYTSTGEGGRGERIPAWANRVVQDDNTKIFSAQVWAPEKPFKFKKEKLLSLVQIHC